MVTVQTDQHICGERMGTITGLIAHMDEIRK